MQGWLLEFRAFPYQGKSEGDGESDKEVRGEAGGEGIIKGIKEPEVYPQGNRKPVPAWPSSTEGLELSEQGSSWPPRKGLGA